MHDIPPILDLINGYAAKGVMLPRTEFEMSEAIRDFTVVLSGEKLLGCGALHFYSPDAGGDPLAGGPPNRPKPSAWAASWWSAGRAGARNMSWTPFSRSPM
jgi:hypothetical protein